MPDLGNNTIFSQTDASNTTGSNPGWPENMLASRVNDAARALQGAVKRDWDYEHYTVTSAGTASVQTLTYAVAPELNTNQMFGFIAGFSVTGAHTLNINAVGAKSVKKIVANVLTDPAANDWLAGDQVKVRYDGTYFVLVGKLAASIGSATVASATTTNIGAAGVNDIQITGTTTITAFDSIQAGTTRTLRFAAALTLTHNGTSLILPGATNIQTAAGDTAMAVSLGSGNWAIYQYQFAGGAPVYSQTGTVQTPTSGTTSGQTGIPSWAKKIVVQAANLNIASGNINMQIGTSGGYVATGYDSEAFSVTGSNTCSVLTPTTVIGLSGLAAQTTHGGSITFTNVTGNTWSWTGQFGASSASGWITLGGVLDRIQFISSAGAFTSSGSWNYTAYSA